jgi:hypothetical protein
MVPQPSRVHRQELPLLSLLLSTAPLDRNLTPANDSPARRSVSASPLLRHSDDSRVRRYASAFADVMEMRASSPVVAQYLDHHEGWFRRCAAPMTVQPLGSHGYALTLGTFGNDVEFNASLRLDEASDSLPLTLVRWELDLSVWIRLPGVITLLPEGLVQSSGDHLLRQIVRQISRRLTWKVQEDFHASHKLDCPPRRRAQF